MKFWGTTESSSAGRTERGLCDRLDDTRAPRPPGTDDRNRRPTQGRGDWRGIRLEFVRGRRFRHRTGHARSSREALAGLRRRPSDGRVDRHAATVVGGHRRGAAMDINTSMRAARDGWLSTSRMAGSAGGRRPRSAGHVRSGSAPLRRRPRAEPGRPSTDRRWSGLIAPRRLLHPRLPRPRRGPEARRPAPDGALRLDRGPPDHGHERDLGRSMTSWPSRSISGTGSSISPRKPASGSKQRKVSR
jgi:hypothetical protein